MAKLPDAEVLVLGLIVSMEEKRNFETKALEGYRATLVGAGGGACIVNFSLTDPLPLAPLMTQVIWRVRNGAWTMEKNSGMSTKFLGTVDESYLLGLVGILEENAARYPVKAAA